MEKYWLMILVNAVILITTISINIPLYKYIKYNSELDAKIEKNSVNVQLVEETTPSINYDELVELSEKALNVATVNEIKPNLDKGNIYDAITATRSQTKYATPSYFSKLDNDSKILFITDSRFSDVRKSVRLDYDVDLINSNTDDIRDLYNLVKEVKPEQYSKIVISPTLCKIEKNAYASTIDKLFYHLLYNNKNNESTIYYVKSNVNSNIQNLIENGYESLADKRLKLMDISEIQNSNTTSDGYKFRSFTATISAFEYILGRV